MNRELFTRPDREPDVVVHVPNGRTNFLVWFEDWNLFRYVPVDDISGESKLRNSTLASIFSIHGDNLYHRHDNSSESCNTVKVVRDIILPRLNELQSSIENAIFDEDE